jgi:hypothetical protein
VNPRPRTKPPLWLWLNLLSLDAPLVAVVWQDFVARCYSPSLLRAPGRLTLGLTVWVIYLADRLIDIRHPPEANEPARHQFYRDNQKLSKILLAAAALADLIVAVLWLRPVVFSSGLWVGAAVVVYLIGFALFRIGATRWKRPSAAILFTTGVFLVAWTSGSQPWRTLGWPAAVFSALCLCNLALIENWEQHRSTVRGWIWPLLLAVVCLGFVNSSRWFGAVAAGAAGLAILDFMKARLSPDARRVLADLVLLTPLLFGPT